MNAQERLDAIVRDVLRLDPSADPSGVRYRETPTWDSVAHILLLTEFEDAFGIRIDGADASGMVDYASMLALIGQACSQRGNGSRDAGSGGAP